MFSLQLTIICATDLRHPPDIAAESGAAVGCNAYCTCCVQGKPHSETKTLVVHGSTNPVWNHTVGIADCHSDSVLEFKVYHNNTTQVHDFLGEVVLECSSFYPSFFNDQMQLQKNASAVDSYLHVQVSFAGPSAGLSPSRPVSTPSSPRCKGIGNVRRRPTNHSNSPTTLRDPARASAWRPSQVGGLHSPGRTSRFASPLRHDQADLGNDAGVTDAMRVVDLEAQVAVLHAKLEVSQDLRVRAQKEEADTMLRVAELEERLQFQEEEDDSSFLPSSGAGAKDDASPEVLDELEWQAHKIAELEALVAARDTPQTILQHSSLGSRSGASVTTSGKYGEGEEKEVEKKATVEAQWSRGDMLTAAQVTDFVTRLSKRSGHALLGGLEIKTDEEQAFITRAVCNNSTIAELGTPTSEHLHKLVQACWHEDIPAGREIYREGDIAADRLYVVRSGVVRLASNGEEDVYVSDGGCFGEFELIYLCPRTKTAETVRDSVVWIASRSDFTRTLLATSEDTIDSFTAVLGATVPFDSLPMEKKRAIALDVREGDFVKGDVLLRRGDAGNTLYIVCSGSVSVTRDNDETMSLNIECRGGIPLLLGEVALLSGSPQAMTAVVTSDLARILVLPRDCFLTMREWGCWMQGEFADMQRDSAYVENLTQAKHDAAVRHHLHTMNTVRALVSDGENCFREIRHLGNELHQLADKHKLRLSSKDACPKSA